MTWRYVMVVGIITGVSAVGQAAFAQEGDAKIHGGMNTAEVEVEARTYVAPGTPQSGGAEGISDFSGGGGSGWDGPPVLTIGGVQVASVCGGAPGDNRTLLFADNIAGSGCLLGFAPAEPGPGGGGPGGGGGNPGPSPGRIIDRVIELVAAPELELAPAEVGLTGLETYVWIDPPEDVAVTAVAGGTSVQARAFPSQYLWDWGDGDDTLTYHSGRSWTKRRPGTIEHVYETRGRYDLSVEVVWEAQWRIGGGPWQPLGFFSLADTIDYPVRQIQARLTRTSS